MRTITVYEYKLICFCVSVHASVIVRIYTSSSTHAVYTLCNIAQARLSCARGRLVQRSSQREFCCRRRRESSGACIVHPVSTIRNTQTHNHSQNAPFGFNSCSGSVRPRFQQPRSVSVFSDQCAAIRCQKKHVFILTTKPRESDRDTNMLHTRTRYARSLYSI